LQLGYPGVNVAAGRLAASGVRAAGVVSRGTHNIVSLVLGFQREALCLVLTLVSVDQSPSTRKRASVLLA
jgi:hypothetical protein